MNFKNRPNSKNLNFRQNSTTFLSRRLYTFFLFFHTLGVKWTEKGEEVTVMNGPYYSSESAHPRFDLSTAFPHSPYMQPTYNNQPMPMMGFPTYMGMGMPVGNNMNPGAPIMQTPPAAGVSNNQSFPIMYPTPYPKYNTQNKTQPSIMSQFKTADGNYDINKVMNTAGQMVGAMNQLTSVVKGISGVFKI